MVIQMFDWNESEFIHFNYIPESDNNSCRLQIVAVMPIAMVANCRFPDFDYVFYSNIQVIGKYASIR